MLRILRFLFTGSWHEHHWETIKNWPWRDGFGGEGIRYYCRCTICGKHKKFD